MRYITNIFLKGLGTVLPVALTLYLVYWLGRSMEMLLRPVLMLFLPEGAYWPGMGLVAGLCALFGIGLLVEAWIIRRLIEVGERILEKIPLIKSIYAGLRDFMDYFTRLKEDQGLSRVVSVRFGDVQLIGFLTGGEQREELPGGKDEQLVSVYLPMSYQVGGFTVYLPKERIQPLDLSVEDAMRQVLTAGLSGKQAKKGSPRHESDGGTP